MMVYIELLLWLFLLKLFFSSSSSASEQINTDWPKNQLKSQIVPREHSEYCKNNQFCFSRIKSTQINKRAVRFNQTFEIIKNALIRVCCVHESEDV
jgi:hypothetical protein